jgi:hypothetical protein
MLKVCLGYLKKGHENRSAVYNYWKETAKYYAHRIGVFASQKL